VNRRDVPSLALLILMLALVGATGRSVLAQSLGPPVPGVTSPAGVPVPMMPSATSDGFNPLTMLDSVGDSLASRGMTAPSSVSPGGEPGADGSRGGLSAAINILIVLTVVSLAPSIMLMTTCFMRIIIVLGVLKQALGTQSIPPPQVTVALALFMTLLVMTPTIDRINQEAVVPYRAGQIADHGELWDRAKQPVRDFMFDQIEATENWSCLYMVLNYRGVDTSRPERLTRSDVDMVSLIPAYMLSELKVAFLMGFRVYLPFLVIDMVISSLLISMSMMMLPPVLVSLPFKVLLFVLVDGWQLVVGSLMQSFVQPDGVARQSSEVAMSVARGVGWV
jgi:flagellar biosynthesis protein FliP